MHPVHLFYSMWLHQSLNPNISRMEDFYGNLARMEINVNFH